MPWLCATALLHCNLMLAKKGDFKIWTAFLAILSFTLCLLGIFLVRSGILTSVHSFAADPSRGIFIIILLLLISGSALAIFAFKAKNLQSATLFENLKPSSVSFMVLINAFLISVALFIVLLGTLYPLILQAVGAGSISIGPSYYNKLFSPLAASIVLLMLFAPRVRFSKFSSLPMILGHSGMLLIILAIFLNSIFSSNKEVNLKVGQKAEISGYEINFIKEDYLAGKNYIARQGLFKISKNNQEIAVLKPQFRYFPVTDQSTVESAIKYFLFADLHIIMGQKDENDFFAVRIYYKAFMSFIWLGCLMIFFSFLTSFIRKNAPRKQ
jgi:cytochrome c-type biogenesis protein CcmF